MSARRLGLLAVLAAVAAAVAARLLKAGSEEPAPPSEPPSTPSPPPPDPAPAAAAVSPPAAGETSTKVDGYCVRERKKVEIAQPKAVKTKNGRDAIRGKCPDCGASIFRMGKLPGA